MRPLAGVIVAICLSVALPGAELTAVQLTQALQRKYDSIKDLSADFVHTYQGGVLRKQLTERGHVWIKKPGKMRWEYMSPEKKLFVSDGVKIYSHLPADNQVIVNSVPEGPGSGDAGGPAMFLAGKGNLMRDFTPSATDLPKGFSGGARAVKLVPKTPQPDYDALIVVVDPQSFGLQGWTTVDPQGGRATIAFANLKENVGTPDKIFAFSIPRGAEVINDATR